MPSSMTPNRRPTVTPPHVVSAEPSAEPSADQSAMKRKRRSWIRKIRRLRLKEEHRTKFLGVLAEMLEDNLALALLPTLRNHKKLIAELKQEFEYWALYGPISDEEKEEKEKDKKRTVGDFIKNWCSPSIEFKIFSYFAESPFKQQLIDQVTGKGHCLLPLWRNGYNDSPQFRSHRDNMKAQYTVCRERPWRFLCRELSCSGNSLRLKYAINPIVKLLWNVMRKKNSGKDKGVGYAMFSMDLYPILEMNNIGRNKSHRKFLAPSWGRLPHGHNDSPPAGECHLGYGREQAVRLLMST